MAFTTYTKESLWCNGIWFEIYHLNPLEGLSIFRFFMVERGNTQGLLLTYMESFSWIWRRITHNSF